MYAIQVKWFTDGKIFLFCKDDDEGAVEAMEDEPEEGSMAVLHEVQHTLTMRCDHIQKTVLNHINGIQCTYLIFVHAHNYYVFTVISYSNRISTMN